MSILIQVCISLGCLQMFSFFSIQIYRIIYKLKIIYLHTQYTLCKMVSSLHGLFGAPQFYLNLLTILQQYFWVWSWLYIFYFNCNIPLVTNKYCGLFMSALLLTLKKCQRKSTICTITTFRKSKLTCTRTSIWYTVFSFTLRILLFYFHNF